MKKGQEDEGSVERLDFPNKGIVNIEGEDKKVVVKDVIPGQKVKVLVTKTRKDKAEGRLLEVIDKAAEETAVPKCPKFGICGGCNYQTLPYEEQLKLKMKQVKALLDPVCGDYEFEGIKGSPLQWEYRNKMEFSFGDEYKDGPLSLGMHKKGSFYDIVNADECQLVDEDYRKIIKCTVEHMAERNIPHYHKMRHTGCLRHLLVRKAVKTGEILVDLVTSSQYVNMIGDGAATFNLMTAERYLGLSEWADKLLALNLKGKLTGILHTVNNSLADVVQNDETTLLYGQDYFYEELLGLKFKITPFSFFQTNSLGAEVLYDTARSYVGETKDKLIFDLYSGTGTIAQMLAPVAKKVVGVEIIEEAVDAAKKNAELNGLTNCEFIAGDVLKMLDTIEDKPDLIVLDPPRDGIHPKALQKIINYGVDRMVYISCKPTSLARDLEVLTAQGYKVEKACLVDMFANSVHCENVVLLQKIK